MESGETVEAGHASEPVQWRSATLLLIVAVVVTAPLDVPLVSPALPAIRDVFGLSATETGLVITVFALPGIVIAPVIGILTDRVGRRRVLVPCLLINGIAGGLVLIAEDFATVLALRFIQGFVGGTIISSLAMTLVGDFYRGTQRNAVMGVITAAMVLSAAIYPAIGGWLAVISWDAPFAVYLLSAVVAVAVYVDLDEPVVPGTGEGLDWADLKTYAREALASVPLRPMLGLYGATFVGFSLLFGGLYTSVTFLLDEAFSLGPGRIGSLITAALLLAALVAVANGRLARHATNGELIALGLFGYGAGLAGIPLANSVTGALAALLVFGLGHGLIVPSIATALADLGPGRFRGGVMSGRTSVLITAQAAGPTAFGLAAAVIGYPATLLAAGIGAATIGAATMLVLTWQR